MMGVDVSAQSRTAILSSLISDSGYKIRVLASLAKFLQMALTHPKNGNFLADVIWKGKCGFHK